jgi:hypothetical protein
VIGVIPLGWLVIVLAAIVRWTLLAEYDGSIFLACAAAIAMR